jgi:hypothetical protein
MRAKPATPTTVVPGITITSSSRNNNPATMRMMIRVNDINA